MKISIFISKNAGKLILTKLLNIEQYNNQQKINITNPLQLY